MLGTTGMSNIRNEGENIVCQMIKNKKVLLRDRKRRTPTPQPRNFWQEIFAENFFAEKHLQRNICREFLPRNFCWEFFVKKLCWEFFATWWIDLELQWTAPPPIGPDIWWQNLKLQWTAPPTHWTWHLVAKSGTTVDAPPPIWPDIWWKNLELQGIPQAGPWVRGVAPNWTLG